MTHWDWLKESHVTYPREQNLPALVSRASMAACPRVFRLRTCGLVIITSFLVWIGFRFRVSPPLRTLSDDEDYRVRESVLVQLEGREGHRQVNGGVGREGGAMFVIFTTWLAREDKRLVHDNVLRTWRQWQPAILPVLFAHEVSVECSLLLCVYVYVCVFVREIKVAKERP